MLPNLKEQVVEEASKNYWSFLLTRKEELKHFLNRLFMQKTHLDLLEVGCYKGMLKGWLEENFPPDNFSWSYVGVDLIEPEDRSKDYKHYIMNAECLEFPAESFDAVIMIELVEHVVDYVKALQEAYRVLRRRGGLFIQSVICYDKCALADKTHFHVLHPETLARLLRWIGFKHIEYKEGDNFAIWGFKQ